MLIPSCRERGAMRGTFDEASLRLARALQRPPEHVEAALQDVGVDAPYLARALVEGDPQGAIDAVSQRLGVPSRELVTAILRSSGGPEADARRTPEAHRAGGPGESEVEELVTRRLPVILSRAAVLSLVLGLGLAGFASLAVWAPDLFRALLVYAAAGLVGLLGLLLVVAAWRMQRAARVLRRMRTRASPTKR